jgi:hypothetical protein
MRIGDVMSPMLRITQPSVESAAESPDWGRWFLAPTYVVATTQHSFRHLVYVLSEQLPILRQATSSNVRLARDRVRPLPTRIDQSIPATQPSVPISHLSRESRLPCRPPTTKTPVSGRPVRPSGASLLRRELPAVLLHEPGFLPLERDLADDRAVECRVGRLAAGAGPEQ